MEYVPSTLALFAFLVCFSVSPVVACASPHRCGLRWRYLRVLVRLMILLLLTDNRVAGAGGMDAVVHGMAAGALTILPDLDALAALPTGTDNTGDVVAMLLTLNGGDDLDALPAYVKVVIGSDRRWPTSGRPGADRFSPPGPDRFGPPGADRFGPPGAD
eukprot:9477285-Pyramimonas_sp.AAC.1